MTTLKECIIDAHVELQERMTNELHTRSEHKVQLSEAADRSLCQRAKVNVLARVARF